MKEQNKKEQIKLEDKVNEICEFADKNGYKGSDYVCKLEINRLCLDSKNYENCIHYKKYIKDRKMYYPQGENEKK